MDDQILKELKEIKKYILLGAKGVFNIDEATMFIGLSKSRIQHLASAKDIPHFKRDDGRALYFKRADLEEWMASRRIMTNEELGQFAISHTRRKKVM